MGSCGSWAKQGELRGRLGTRYCWSWGVFVFSRTPARGCRDEEETRTSCEHAAATAGLRGLQGARALAARGAGLAWRRVAPAGFSEASPCGGAAWKAPSSDRACAQDTRAATSERGSRQGRRPSQGAETNGPMEGALEPAPAPMPLRSPRVGSAGHTSECPRRQEHVHPQACQSLVKSWRVGCRPTPRGDGPPRRQGGGSRGRKADTEVRALAAGIGCAVGACVHIRLRDRRGHRPRARAQQLQGGGGGPGQEHVSPTCGRRQRAQWLGARASFGLPEPHL